MEECRQDFPTEVVKQNQFVLNLLHQFGNGNAATENELEDVTFTIMGRSLCEDCLCILFDVSDSRYQRIKNFYRVNIFNYLSFSKGVSLFSGESINIADSLLYIHVTIMSYIFPLLNYY